MLLTDIIKKYKRGKICLIDINAKEIHSLRIAIAYSDIRAIRNIALKSIDFIITKLIRLNGAYAIPLSEIKQFASDPAKGGKGGKYDAMRSYLHYSAKNARGRHEKALLISLYHHLAGLFHEHSFLDALLFEYSSAFLKENSEKDIEKNGEAILNSIILAISGTEAELKRINDGIADKSDRINTEMLRLFSQKGDWQNRKEENDLIRCKRRISYETENKLRNKKCQRVRISKMRNEVDSLFNSLCKLEAEHRKRYFKSLFDKVRYELITADSAYSKLFDETQLSLEAFKENRLSKRSLMYKSSLITSHASSKGGRELKLAKIALSAMLETIYAEVKKREIALLFDIASEGVDKGMGILNNELKRIEETKRATSYPRP